MVRPKLFPTAPDLFGGYPAAAANQALWLPVHLPAPQATGADPDSHGHHWELNLPREPVGLGSDLGLD